MMGSVDLRSTVCAICSTPGNATELYPANFDAEVFNPATFSARRLPDRIHYRMVKCQTCGLVRADPAADARILAQLYARSSFAYGDEVANIRYTYGRYLVKAAHYGARKEALLEIGCGNGFFLEEALAQGYGRVRGVEPSTAALAGANPAVRSLIICDVMRPGLFKPSQFDVICLFQVFDHIPNPGTLLDECFAILKPGGLILCLNHNIDAPWARLLGARCPIIDIEHTYLYSAATMTRIFVAHGFAVRRVGPVYNRYTMRYLAHLAPLPTLPKRLLLGWMKRTPIGRIRLSVPLGNLHVVAQKVA